MTTVQKLSPRSQTAWDAFRARVAELGGEVLEPAWLGTNRPHRVRCAAGHDCAPHPGSVQQGRGICCACVGHDSQAAETAFRQRLTELGATLLEPRWLGNRRPHRVRCANGHDCLPRPTGVQQGQGICRTCAGNDSQAAWATFRARVEELGGEVLESAWLGKDKPHRVRCVEGHENTPRPNNVQQGWGICTTCAGKDPQVAEAAFRARVAELGGEVLEPRWLGVGTPHLVRCGNGHDCTPYPNAVRQGVGICWACRGHQPDVFYVVTDDINGVVKFGITSGDPRPRLGSHARDGFGCVIRLIENLSGDLAPRLERAVIAALRDAREAPVRGREYFPARVLGLVLDVVDGWTAATPAPAAHPVQLALDIAA